MLCFHINLNWPQVKCTNHIRFKFLCHYIGNKDSQERNLRCESDCLYHSHSKFLNVGCNVAIIAEVRSSYWSYGPCIVWPQNCTKLLPILISSTGLTFDSWPAINRCMGQEEKTLLVAVNFFIQRRRMKTIFKQVWWWWISDETQMEDGGAARCQVWYWAHTVATQFYDGQLIIVSSYLQEPS